MRKIKTFYGTMDSMEKIYSDYKHSTPDVKAEYDKYFIHDFNATTCQMYHIMRHDNDISYVPEFLKGFSKRQLETFFHKGFYGSNHIWNSMLLFNEDSPVFYRGKVETLIVGAGTDRTVFMSQKAEDDLISYRLPGGSFERNVTHLTQARQECAEEALIDIVNVIDTGITYILTDKRLPEKYKDVELCWAGKYVELYVGEYGCRHTGYIPIPDRDSDMATNGKFYDFDEIKSILTPTHMQALRCHSKFKKDIRANVTPLSFQQESTNITEHVSENDSLLNYIQENTKSLEGSVPEENALPMKCVPYFTPIQMMELGVFNENASDNCYDVKSSQKYNQWFQEYCATNVVSDDWYTMVQEAYEAFIGNPCNETKQNLLECGWNPELPFTASIMEKRSKIVREALEQLNPEPLQETYFGITKELSDCIDALSAFRSKYVPTDDNVVLRSRRYFMKHSNIATDPDLIRFNQCMAKMFNIKEYQLLVEESENANAMTIPVIYRNYDVYCSVQRTSTGFKYKSPNNYMLMTVITTTLLFEKNMTDKEIMAILLHEIGHNFSFAFSPAIYGYDIMRTLAMPVSIIATLFSFLYHVQWLNFNAAKLDLMSMAMLTNPTMKLYNVIHKQLNSGILQYPHSFISELIAAVEDYTNIVLKVIPGTYLIYALKYFVDDAINKALNPSEWLFTYIRYSDEKIADSFATIYGLGPDLQNALKKLSDIDFMPTEVMKKIPIYKYLYDLTTLPINIIATLFDEHPDVVSRVVNQTNYLKAELDNTNISPSMRKEIKKNLEYCTEIEKEFTKIDRSKASLFRDVYNKLIYKIGKGDFKQILSRMFDKKRDNYNKMLNGEKFNLVHEEE